jgi:F-type H+-transporting ATPase subunit alpha
LTQLLVQNRYEPMDIVDQMIFLYAALNGYLDGVPVNLVSIYEKELFLFMKSTFFYLPLQVEAREVLHVSILNYVLDLFSKNFLENIKIFYDDRR